MSELLDQRHTHLIYIYSDHIWITKFLLSEMRQTHTGLIKIFIPKMVMSTTRLPYVVVNLTSMLQDYLSLKLLVMK